MRTQVACWNCGFSNSPGSRFCANCGKPQKQTCPECGAEIVQGAKFCANCGIPLAAAEAPVEAAPVFTAEARKVVTVLFADLVGSTGLTERLDPEESRDVVRKFYDMVEHVVERWFAGTVANLMGDAVLAIFGLPVAHEDDPERAVRAGLAIRDAMPILNGHLAVTHGVQLAVRVGINTGEVVAASGSTFDRDFLVSDAVTTAARLQQTVSPGTVVVGERTHRLTRDAVEYRDLPPLQVKGKGTPLTVWAAVAPLPEQADVKRATAPLVGRHAELGLLGHLYHRSREEDRVHLVTIFGQPGVGKSRLLREFLAEVRDLMPQPMVLRGRSVAFGGQIGYHALLDILRFQAGLLDTDSPETVRAKLAAWLNEKLPNQPDLLDGLLLTFGTQDGVSGDPGQIRQRLYQTWQSLISGVAESQPVILALEDMHWADDGVLDLVEAVVANITAPLLIVCLARPELLERRPTWGGGRRNATSLDLPPLRQDEAEQLVMALGSEGLGPEAIKLIAQRAEGNPLFAEELVRMMLEGSAPGAAIPDTVQAVITARIDRLPPSERRVLQAASVVGRAFWPSAVAPIAGLSVEEARQAIDALIGKELVLSRPRSSIADEREFAFRHILTRDVAYQMLPRTQRQRAHAEAARWLESTIGERAEEVIEILAEHLRLAGDEARASTYLHRAGGKARRLYANADAIRLFDQALEAAAKAALSPSQLAAIYRDRGEVYQLLGSYREAMTDFEHGLLAARQAGDQALEAVLEDLVGLIHHRQHRLDDAERRFARAAEIARVVGDRLTLGRSLVDLANIAWDRGRMGPDHPAIVEGLALLRQTGDLSSLARALNMLCMAYLGTGDGVRALESAEQALTAAREASDKSKEATSLSYLGHVNSYLGLYDRARQHTDASMAVAREIQDRRRIAYTLFFLGRINFWTGRLGDAIAQLEESVPMSQETVPTQLPWLFLYLGNCFHEAGDDAGAARAFADGSRFDAVSARWWQPSLICRISLASITDRATGWDALIGDIAAAEWDEFVPAGGEVLLAVGRLLTRLGRHEALRAFIAARRRSIERLNSATYAGLLHLLEADAAALAGAPEDALRHLEQTIHLSRTAGTVITERAALEQRLRLRGEEHDRTALRILLGRIADSLSGDLRAAFLANPRGTLLKE